MPTPVIHVLVGPNGAGKSTFVTEILQPVTHLPFVNADVIAAERWPEDTVGQAYEAAQLAEAERQRLLAGRRSFITETVFSHPSKLELVRQSLAFGYLVRLRAILVPVDLTVSRVGERVARGGHPVPEAKVRERYARLWSIVADAARIADRADFYDNSSAGSPFGLIATVERGRLIGEPAWPGWTPAALVS